jgi:hypothetical protein
LLFETSFEKLGELTLKTAAQKIVDVHGKKLYVLWERLGENPVIQARSIVK